MAPIATQSSWVPSPHCTTVVISKKKSFTFSFPFAYSNSNSSSSSPTPRTLRVSSSSSQSSAESSEPTSSNASESNSESEIVKRDPVKLAFAKAKAYKSLKTRPSSSAGTVQNPAVKSTENVGIENGVEGEEAESEIANKDPVKLAFAKAKAYKSLKKRPNSSSGTVQNPAVKSAENVGIENGIVGEEAIKSGSEETNEYTSKHMVVDDRKKVEKNQASSGLKGGVDGVLRSGYNEKEVGNKEAFTVSEMDFMGLNFSDKKIGRALPAGLVPVDDPFQEGDLPDVELIVGDKSKFETSSPVVPDSVQEDDSYIYKPKVSTWGVFPRPSNISETFGGGRTIRPGEVLETAEDKEVKEAKTRQLLAAYRKKIGLNISPTLRSECEKNGLLCDSLRHTFTQALKDGDYLMDLGKLKDALPYYELVMDKLAFQNELHGLAALQWSICQDSLRRSNEARVMYEKLLTHPNAKVSKKARQFMFAFKAMEMMKVKSSSAYSKSAGYQNYFEAFVKDDMNYTVNEDIVEDGAFSQTIPYIIILIGPVVLVGLLALRKGAYF